MSRDLYQRVILDHNRNPRNQGEMENPHRQARGENPLCGDEVTVYLKLDEEHNINDISFMGKGCAISQAATSMLTEAMLGKTLGEANLIIDAYTTMVKTGDKQCGTTLPESLQALAGVYQFPSRIKCATLGWQAFSAACNDENSSSVSTEN